MYREATYLEENYGQIIEGIRWPKLIILPFKLIVELTEVAQYND